MTLTKGEQIEENAIIRAKLLAAFHNEPQNYEWNGEIVEGDEKSKCACGHPIRWMFIWTHKTDTSRASVTTGSTCVNTVPGLDPATVARMQEVAAELLKEEAKKKRDAIAKAKKAMKTEEVQKALALFNDKFSRCGLLSYVNNTEYGWVPHEIYIKRREAHWYTHQIKKCLKYKAVGTQLNKINDLIKNLEEDYGV